MKNLVIWIWQLITYFIIGIPLRIIYKVNSNYQFKYQAGAKYIVAANHPNKIDPFIISYSFPLKDFIRIIPFRFITADIYMKKWYKPILILYGCITTKKTSKGSVLKRSKKLLDKGETIFIFPSGEVEKLNKTYKPKIGVAYLKKHVKNSEIIPVNISYSKKPNKMVNVEFKESPKLKSKPNDLQETANNINEAINTAKKINKNSLYKLPWTANNNPNGWLEPTTYCQLKCPGCYRGLAEDNPKRKHETLESLKKEVDWLIKNRNVQSISIAGGEPLMYPELDSLIEYISSKKLKTKIYSNAVALTESKLNKLKKSGASEVIIHIDKFQRNISSETEMNLLREKYCKMFRKVKGINLGFIMSLSKQNISDLPVLAKFFQKNSDIISLVVFTVYKEMLPNKLISINNKISMNEVSQEVSKAFNIDYCAYLGKTKSDSISWLFSLNAYNKGKLLGSFNNNFYKKIQKRYYKKRGKYFLTVKNKPISKNKLFLWSTNSSVRNILKNLPKSEKEINSQVVLIIDAPESAGNQWDLCDGCPDAMLHNGKLVPSCLLERVKEGEKILVH